MKLLLALVVVLGCSGNEGKPIDQAAGSGSGSSAGSASAADSASFEAQVVELEKYRDKMCACTDAACTENVFKEFTTWRMTVRQANKGKRPTPEVERKGNEVQKALMVCRIKVAKTAGKGSDAGSGSGSAKVSGDPVETALGELEAFKTKMCLCRDKACADKLQTEYAVWQRNMRTTLKEKPNKLQEVRGNAIEKEMKDCRKAAETATPGVAGGTSKIDNFLTQMQGYRDKICACTAKDCATKLKTEMDTWLTTAAKDIADAKPTKDQDDKADRLEHEMKTCIGKLK